MRRLPTDVLTKRVMADTKALMRTPTLEVAGNLLAAAGVDARPVDGGPLLRASTGAGGPRILLLGCLRTEELSSATQVQPRRRGDWLCGRGASTLSGIATALTVLAGETPCEVTLILSPDAELDSLAQRLDSQYDLVVLLQPTNLQLATRAKSRHLVTYVFRSKRGAAPLSDPYANAFTEGGRFLTRQAYRGLDETFAFLLKRMDGFDIATPTLTLFDGAVRAHSETDGIPIEYEALAVLCALPGQDPADLVTVLLAAAKRFEFQLEIELGQGRPAVDTSEDVPGVQVLRQLLLPFEPEGSPPLTGCDEGFLAAGLPWPTVALGPGDRRGRTGAVEIEALARYARVLTELPFALHAHDRRLTLVTPSRPDRRLARRSGRSTTSPMRSVDPHDQRRHQRWTPTSGRSSPSRRSTTPSTAASSSNCASSCPTRSS